MRVTHEEKLFLFKTLKPMQVSEEELAELDAVLKDLPISKPNAVRRMLLLLGIITFWRVRDQGLDLRHRTLLNDITKVRAARKKRGAEAPLAKPA